MKQTETDPKSQPLEEVDSETAATAPKPKPPVAGEVEEIGGPKGPDPTRFGDWSVNGRCYDF